MPKRNIKLLLLLLKFFVMAERVKQAKQLREVHFPKQDPKSKYLPAERSVSGTALKLFYVPVLSLSAENNSSNGTRLLNADWIFSISGLVNSAVPFNL